MGALLYWFFSPFLGFLFGMIMAGWITFVFVKQVSFPDNTWGCFLILCAIAIFLILTFVFGVILTMIFSAMGIERIFHIELV